MIIYIYLDCRGLSSFNLLVKSTKVLILDIDLTVCSNLFCLFPELQLVEILQNVFLAPSIGEAKSFGKLMINHNYIFIDFKLDMD